MSFNSLLRECPETRLNFAAKLVASLGSRLAVLGSCVKGLGINIRSCDIVFKHLVGGFGGLGFRVYRASCLPSQSLTGRWQTDEQSSTHEAHSFHSLARANQTGPVRPRAMGLCSQPFRRLAAGDLRTIASTLHPPNTTVFMAWPYVGNWFPRSLALKV